MTIPTIKNYEQRPPTGGWSVVYEYRGQKFPFSGSWKIVAQKVKNLHTKNSDPITMDEVFKRLNEIWCGRDPARCMSPAQASAAQKASGGTCTRCGGRRRAR